MERGDSMTERKLLKKFRDALKEKLPSCYIYTDRDSPGRGHAGEWDTLISYVGKTIFIEGKVSNNVAFSVVNPLVLLTPHQVKGRKKILESGGEYIILIFYTQMGDTVEVCGPKREMMNLEKSVQFITSKLLKGVRSDF